MQSANELSSQIKFLHFTQKVIIFLSLASGKASNSCLSLLLYNYFFFIFDSTTLDNKIDHPRHLICFQFTFNMRYNKKPAY